MNCPICNKAGLPDFTSKPVICPQCNSNLKGFATLEKSSIVYKKTIRKHQFYFLIIVVVILFTSALLIFSRPKTADNTQILTHKQDSIILDLQSNFKTKELEIINLKVLIDKGKKPQFNYIVKKGDNLSKLAFIFYNNWEEYKRIEKENNLNPESIIFPGDTLKITFNK